ncbi:unnamed protein product [Cylindrotheca closterium]|uniref:Uncharacterized protein n=1 Tax=Cylindrotheca closterium TaxID=2856 RepID=A0AAD2FXM4_9STRA|nr:unnamed protein product [Cylindrotheca closterium]
MKLRSQRVIGGPFDEPFETECSVSSSSTSSSSYRRRRGNKKGSTIQFKNLNDADDANADDASKRYHQVPELRRAGSSTVSTSESSSLLYIDDDDDDDYDASTILSDTLPELTSAGGVFYRTILTQFEAVFMNFYWNGLPWEGYQCRSWKAGLTGAFFCLPMFFCRSNRYEQAWWILQALTSVMADYYYIHTRSAWHGVDRIVAQLSLLGLVARAYFFVRLWSVALLVSLPVSCFTLATRAKDHNDISRWHWCHMLWHIVAPIGCMTGVYLSYNCPNGTVQYSPLDNFCLDTSASTAEAATWFGLLAV